MQAKDFIISEMTNLIKDIKSLKVSYSFHSLSCTHSIEIVPSEVYHENETVKQWEENIILKFIEAFPEQSLCILTEDSISPIENTEFCFEGENFNELVDNNIPSLLINAFDYKFYDTFDVIFSTHSPQILNEITLEHEFIELNSLPSVFPPKIGKKIIGSHFPIQINSETGNSLINEEDIYTFAA